MTQVRLGSVVLLILGLMVIVASVTYIPGPAPALPLGMFGTGVILIVIALSTIRFRDQNGV
ncbi:MAG: hypothetical protein EAX87_09240 [Candidatus Thorarchaeota archaeon]|nr:hypothetical protein [Candidatus Thorarchaeota archaeon]